MQMLHRALIQVLSLGDQLWLHAPLDECAGYSALPKFDCESDADRTSADDDDLMAFHCVYGALWRTKRNGSGVSGTRCQVFASFSSKRQDKPRGVSSTRSLLSMRHDVGLNRVTCVSQPGLSRKVKSSAPADLSANVSAHMGLPVPRSIAQSPFISAA